MIFEIGELDNARQGTCWAGCIGDPLHVEAVVIALRACEKRQRAEVNGAYPPGAQLGDRDVRPLQDVVQPCSDPRLRGDRGGHPPDVLEYGAAGRRVLALVSGSGDRPSCALSHGLPQQSLIVLSRGC